MRVLWCTTPMESVFAFGLPVARALQQSGHELLVATGPDLQERARAEGFDTAVAGPTAMEGAMRAMGDPAVAAAPAGESWHFGAAMFGAVVAPAKYPEIQRLAAEWEPDLVLHPPVDVAAALLGAARGLPSVTYGFGQYLERPLVESLADRVRPMWEAAGLAPDPWAGIYRGRYLDPCPPSLQHGWCPPAIRTANVRLPIPGDPRSQLPGWVHGLGERPVVYLSLGTVPLFNQPEKFRMILEPFADDSDVEVVVTIGTLNDPASLGPQPAHIHIEQWLSLAALLPHCHAVACHAGSGTTLAALTAGLPMILFPQGADQHANAESCARAGVARVIDADAIPTLKAVVDKVVAPGSPESEAAVRVSSEIATMPAPEEVAAALLADQKD